MSVETSRVLTCRRCGETKDPEAFTLRGQINRICERCTVRSTSLGNWILADLKNFKREVTAAFNQLIDDPIVGLIGVLVALVVAAIISAPFLSPGY